MLWCWRGGPRSVALYTRGSLRVAACAAQHRAKHVRVCACTCAASQVSVAYVCGMYVCDLCVRSQIPGPTVQHANV